ncbi:hypothetical protein HRI_001182800 [Hibiscus trionum]|uniref:Uncharacterized protein n=1 Tax=Hibiscus trionum TaxID=183268 RepID=A0A9W7HCM2_HIBTR|nr:hypothetical protein HRI_001182800 [Hibiscus trionum]
MESSEEIEVMNLAIQKLLEDISGEKPSDNHLLSRLFSQLESLKEDGRVKQSEPEEFNPRKGGDVKAEAESVEELRKEIKELKKQNTITHCLVSAMILITLFWQVSEASFLLKLKNGFTHPFRSFGSWLVNTVKTPAKQHNHLIHQPSDLPKFEFPHLGSTVNPVAKKRAN